jgi:tetraacyldisaccharide 4'-kinase
MALPDLSATWNGRGPLAVGLLPLALLYRGALALRALPWQLGWRRPAPLPVPVVVVGNVVAGGAGKTPTVIALVQHLQAAGWRPGVVSRGHGRTDRAAVRVCDDATGDPARLGDEPALIVRRTSAPLAVGHERPAAVRALLQRHPTVDIVVSDDGLQHWALARDLSIIVFDERDVGNGWLLPAGPLREPWPAPVWGGGPALVLRTGKPSAPPRPHPYPEYRATRALADAALPVPAPDEPPLRASQPLADWAAARTPLGALAGIARPHAFFAMLRARGLTLVHTLALPDHAPAAAMGATLQAAATTAGAPRHWLCTEKDAVKLHGQPLPDGVTLWQVPLALTPEPAWYAAIDRHLQAWRRTRAADRSAL